MLNIVSRNQMSYGFMSVTMHIWYHLITLTFLFHHITVSLPYIITKKYWMILSNFRWLRYTTKHYEPLDNLQNEWEMMLLTVECKHWVLSSSVWEHCHQSLYISKWKIITERERDREIEVEGDFLWNLKWDFWFKWKTMYMDLSSLKNLLWWYRFLKPWTDM